MKNKTELKKAFIVSVIIIASFFILFAILYQIQYQTYTKHFNEKLNVIIGELKENGIEFEAIVNDKNRVEWSK